MTDAIFYFAFYVLPAIYVVLCFAALGIGAGVALNVAVGTLLSRSPAIPRATASFHHGESR